MNHTNMSDDVSDEVSDEVSDISDVSDVSDVESEDDDFLNLDDFVDRSDISDTEDDVLIDENFEPVLLLSTDPEISTNKRIKIIKSIFLVFTKHFSSQEQYIICSVYNSNIKNLHIPGKVFYPIGIIIHVFKYFGISFTEYLKKKLFPHFPFTLSSKRAQQLILDVEKRFDFSIFCQKNKISQQFSNLNYLERLVTGYVFYIKLILRNQMEPLLKATTKNGYTASKDSFEELSKKLNINQSFCIDETLQALVKWFTSIIKKLIILNAARETTEVVRSKKINNFEKEVHFMICAAFQIIIQCFHQNTNEARLAYIQTLYPNNSIISDLITDLHFYFVISYTYSVLAIEKTKILHFVSSIPDFLNAWENEA